MMVTESHSAGIYSKNMSKSYSVSTSGFSAILASVLILAALLIGVGGTYWAYTWQHNKVRDLSGRTDSLSSQVTSLNKQVAGLTDQLNKACQGTQSPGSSCAVYAYTSPKGVVIRIFSPAKNATIASPIAIIGEVPGNWSFEAQFPVRLVGSGGAVVASTTAHVLGNWQTSELVPFSAQLTFTTALPGIGQVVLAKDNPSGLPVNDDTITVPVKF